MTAPICRRDERRRSSRSAACACSASTYYGKRHLTTRQGNVKTPADMVGFKLRVPPVDVFKAMAEAWGARATPMNFDELYLALNQNVVDGQENPLPTIKSAQVRRGAEVPRADRAHHHAAPRHRERGVLDRGSRPPTARSSTTRSRTAPPGRTGARRRRKRRSSTPSRAAGMTVIEPDVDSFRKPVLATPCRSSSRAKWGKGTFDKLGRCAGPHDSGSAARALDALVRRALRRRCCWRCSPACSLGVVLPAASIDPLDLDRRARATTCSSGAVLVGWIVATRRRSHIRISDLRRPAAARRRARGLEIADPGCWRRRRSRRCCVRCYGSG